jgi:UDP-N-acetylglucosamine--N-acetylmuramyl-(pentapeptide) pyrophosphoryl-undecaprenol N-acetylglucosamine transferase
MVDRWQGTRILATAAPEIYAAIIGGMLGFEITQGSVYIGKAFHDNIGVGKVTRLRGVVDLPVDLAITDDEVTDGPLLAAARTSKIVRPMTPSRSSPMPRLHIVASLGGHMALLEALEPAFEDLDSTWVTSAGVRAEQLRREGRRVEVIPRLDRSSLSLSAVAAIVRLAVRERPEIVITSGAGLAVPFCLAARVLGARILFAETMARVTSPSMSGRLISRFSDDVFVQWPEVASGYRRATVCKPILLEERHTAQSSTSGTFVTFGSHSQPFPRLMRVLEASVREGLLPRPITVQTGANESVEWADKCVSFVFPDEFEELIGRSALIVTHGGAGAIATAIKAGKKPIVAARRGDLGEHVDDHQRQLVQRLRSLDLIAEVQGAISVEMTRDAMAASETRGALPAGSSMLAAVRLSLERTRDQPGRWLPRGAWSSRR